MNEAIFRSLTYYFKALRSMGFKSYEEVYKVIFLSCVSEIVEDDFDAALSEEDYRDINSAVYAIYGTDCMFPYPHGCCKDETEQVIVVPEEEAELSDEEKLKQMENETKIQELQDTITKLKSNLADAIAENTKLKNDVSIAESNANVLQKSLDILTTEKNDLQSDYDELQEENTSLDAMLDKYLGSFGVSKEDKLCNPNSYVIGSRLASSQYQDRYGSPAISLELYDDNNSDSDFLSNLKYAYVVFFVSPKDTAKYTRKYMSDVQPILKGRLGSGINSDGKNIFGYATNGEKLELNLYVKTYFSFMDLDGKEKKGSHALETFLVFYEAPKIEPTYTSTNVSLKCTTPIDDNVTSKSLTYILYKNGEAYKTEADTSSEHTFTIDKGELNDDDNLYVLVDVDLQGNTGRSETLTINLQDFK